MFSLQLLKKLRNEREMTLRQVIPLLPTRFGDHRDYHELASLFTAGFLDLTIDKGRSNVDRESNEAVSSMLYTMSLGRGEHKYRDKTCVNAADFRDELTLFCTAKTDLYFAEQAQKRNERLLTALISILLAVASAIIGTLVSQAFRVGG